MMYTRQEIFGKLKGISETETVYADAAVVLQIGEWYGIVRE